MVGYPDWYDDKTRNKNAPMGRGRGNAPRTNSTQIVNANSASAGFNLAITDNERQGIRGITDEQWQLIKRVINSTQPTDHLSGKDDVSWILDIGATHHITGRFDLLEEIKDIDPIGCITCWVECSLYKNMALFDLLYIYLL